MLARLEPKDVDVPNNGSDLPDLIVTIEDVIQAFDDFWQSHDPLSVKDIGNA